MPRLTHRDLAVLILFAVTSVVVGLLALFELTNWALAGVACLVGAAAIIGHVQFVARRATYQMIRRAERARRNTAQKPWRGIDQAGASVPQKKGPAGEASEPKNRVRKGAGGDKGAYKGRLDGMTASDIRGWSVRKDRPGETFDVEVLLDGYPYMTTKNTVARGDLRKAGVSHGQGGLKFANPLHDRISDGTEHTLSLRYPDGSTSREYAYTPEARRTSGGSVPGELSVKRGVAVIVPIFNAPDDVKVCIERLLVYTPESASIILIDDCSTDPRVREILSKYRGAARVSVLENEENLGFTRTVNRGIDEVGDDDVVLLNSDARVTPGWLEGMIMAAKSSPRIATVTAMSDRAGAFSAPMIGNENSLPDGVDEISFARAFRRRSIGLYPRVPTGNGFCMWISRECINEIGSLDAQAFPRGYGEENDFCMRAGRAGWIHVIDDRTYVFHDRMKSFGESKGDLLTAGRAVVDTRYPEYKQAIRVFRESSEIALARNRAHLALADASEGRAVIPRVLYVISTTTGGTPQTNADLMNALDDAVEPWILRCDSREITLSRVVDGAHHDVCKHELRNGVEPLAHFSPEYDGVVESWLKQFDFDIVHIRHLLWHSLSLPAIAKRLGMGVVVSFHDYYALSPNLKLIDDNGEFLGTAFTESGSVYRDSGWSGHAHPKPTGDWLRWWQERFWRAISMSDAFVTTSESARDLILAHFTEMDPGRFHVIEHGRDFEVFRQIAAPPATDGPVRILVPGGINAAKGAEILRDMAQADRRHQIEWHVLGPIKEKFESEGSRVVYHGSYKREDFGRLVEDIAPHAGVVLSIWDETYCHTLTEMWSVGLPVFVLDFPNVAQRVRRFNAGWVLRGLDSSSLLAQILRDVLDRDARGQALRGVSDWQNGWGLAWSTQQMAVRYLDIYRRIGSEETISSRDVLRVGVLEFAASGSTSDTGVMALRTRERTSNSVHRPIDYITVTLMSAVASAREGLLDAVIVPPGAPAVATVAALNDELQTSQLPVIVVGDDELNVTTHDGAVRSAAAASVHPDDDLLRRTAVVVASTEGFDTAQEREGDRTLREEREQLDSFVSKAVTDYLHRDPQQAQRMM